MAWEVKRCTFIGRGRYNMMLTSGDTSDREDDGNSRFDPNNPDVYRCPVSTPANNNKRPLDEYEPITNTIAPAFHDKQHLRDYSRYSLTRQRTRDLQQPMRKNVEYYFVDKTLQQKEAKVTNTFWLQSLCAQPVGEILGKYRRKSEFQRTRYLWSRMFSTPGERALLQAWTHNAPETPKSAVPVEKKNYRKQELTLSKEVSISSEPSVKSAGSRRSRNAGVTVDHIRLPQTENLGNENSDNKTLFPGNKNKMSNLNKDQGHEHNSTQEKPLNQMGNQSSRRKGHLVLQQRKYFSGNRKSSSTSRVQSLNPVRADEISQTSDNICLYSTQTYISPRTGRHMAEQKRESPGRDSKQRLGSAHSTSDIDNIQAKFPLIVSTKTGSEEKTQCEETNPVR